MARIAAIGERPRVTGLLTAGVEVFPAHDPDAVRAAWDALPAHVALVILTPAAAAALPPDRLDGDRPLTAVMPP
ncbi:MULTISPECIES: V-type ATP synthase subunit F [unclassified Streptomyces]|uniref:V-type ATP synthase subunit F n=1 Tax=unclassified Streptomyces TaxID=2593676 RepID=UPI003D73B959